MNVSDVMTTSVHTSGPEETLKGLWRVFFAKHINAVPVVDKKKRLLGIITKEDLLESLFPDYQEYFEDITTVGDFEVMENKLKELGSMKARDLMNKRVIFTRTDTPVMRALSRMIVRRVNQMPVLSPSDAVVGLITKGDIFYALVRKESNFRRKSPRT